MTKCLKFRKTTKTRFCCIVANVSSLICIKTIIKPNMATTKEKTDIKLNNYKYKKYLEEY